MSCARTAGSARPDGCPQAPHLLSQRGFGWSAACRSLRPRRSLFAPAVAREAAASATAGAAPPAFRGGSLDGLQDRRRGWISRLRQNRPMPFDLQPVLRRPLPHRPAPTPRGRRGSVRGGSRSTDLGATSGARPAPLRDVSAVLRRCACVRRRARRHDERWRDHRLVALSRLRRAGQRSRDRVDVSRQTGVAARTANSSGSCSDMPSAAWSAWPFWSVPRTGARNDRLRSSGRLAWAPASMERGTRASSRQVPLGVHALRPSPTQDGGRECGGEGREADPGECVDAADGLQRDRREHGAGGLDGGRLTDLRLGRAEAMAICNSSRPGSSQCFR